jgi:hypothetical protein
VRATGDNNKKGTKMNSPMTRVLTAAIVGVLAASFAAPSFAQTRVKRQAAPVPVEQGETYTNWNARAAHPGAPATVANQPGACFTDEGYGRYASCDQAGD